MPETNARTAELRNITKQYPGSVKLANNDISLDLRKGEILCIAGENGAGKTTLMKILCGLEKADGGQILVNGKIGMVHQHFMLFPEFTVAENIVMGVEPRKWKFFFDKKQAEQAADKIIDGQNFQIQSGQKVKDLTLGQMQQVEICRILHRDAQIIVLDEPTSILTEAETASMFKTLKNLAAQGKSVILITHKLREIQNNCDRVAVLRQGKLIGVREASQIDENEIAKMIVGDDVSQLETPVKRAQEPETKKEGIIVFDNVTVRRRGQKRPLLDKVSFSAGSSEILGFAGVGGNGLGVIEAVLGGFLHPAEGRVLHCGNDISYLNIRRLREQGLSYVPADRLRVGSAASATIEENMIINCRQKFVKNMIFDKKAVCEFSKKLTARYDIEGAQIYDKCSSLSGGNLQKLILAREISNLKD
jgi:simple sugar transport system ATP-binding protein